jgi:hypothetical protein
MTCEQVKNRQTNKNLQNPYSSLYLISAYISEKMKNKLTTPDTPKNTHFNQSIGTTFSAVVIMNIVKE